MKKEYKSGNIRSAGGGCKRDEYLLWCGFWNQIGCMPADGSEVHLFSTAGLTVADLVHVAAIMQQMSADFTKKRKKKGDAQ